MENESAPEADPAGEVQEQPVAPETKAGFLERLSKVNAQREAARSELAEAKARIAELEQLSGQVETLTQERDVALESIALADVGYRSEEGRDLVRFLYGRQPEDARGTLTEFASTTEHPALSAYRPQPSGPAGAPTGAPKVDAPETIPAPQEPSPQKPTVSAPTPNTGARPAPPISGPSLEEVVAARKRYQSAPNEANLKAFRSLNERYMVGSTS